jgi:hypothetical protein
MPECRAFDTADNKKKNGLTADRWEGETKSMPNDSASRGKRLRYTLIVSKI